MDAHPVPAEQDADPPFDFWPYVDTVPIADSNGHDFSAGTVAHAWTMPISNVFLVLVLDVARGQAHGHHLLDLRSLYELA